MTSSCTRAQSFLASEVAAVCLWLSLDLSLVPSYDADWRPLVCFGPTNRRQKNYQASVFSAQRCRRHLCARVRREPCQVGNRFALFHVSLNTEISSNFPFPSHKWNCQSIVEQRLKVLRSFKSDAVLSLGSSPTETSQSPPSPISIRLTCCWRQEQVKLAMDEVERKEAKRRARMTPGKIERQREKTWRLEQTKEGRCLTLARWCVGMNVDIVNVQSFFFLFWVLLGISFIFKQGGSRWKRYFRLRLLRGWSANVTRLHWSSCQCQYLSNGLDDDVPCIPNEQYS